MSKVNLDLDDLTNAALKRMVKQLLAANEAEERKLVAKYAGKNDLADLDEEMHGKPNTPEVEDDDAIPEGDELPDVPKRKGKQA